MKNRNWIILANLLIVLIVANILIIKKEKTIKTGDLILLELRPVDPRSLMQGDYMTLSYSVVRELREADSIPNRGFLVVKCDGNSVASKLRVQSDKSPLDENEYLIKYYSGDRNPTIGSESFFFQEGKGEIYEKAKYGGVKAAKSGNIVLIGLYDENFQLIESESKIKI